MSRKAEAPGRRSPRRRPLPSPEAVLLKAERKEARASEPQDSDFGLCLALAPALRKRSDA